ncbi:mechanosensitive ion channel family protein [Dehalogenimonas sp. THU2]|uniref:mechanosensitive ion channel family protein n=1 Tax=Dehalogenimonas sp. THU2 TaxID=3151121 RepID=UPI003218A6B2
MDWGILFDDFTAWMGDHGLTILLITAGSLFFYNIVKVFVTRVVQRYIDFRKRSHHDKEEDVRRVKTLTGMVVGTLGAVITAMAVFMILSELSVNIGPLIASAGVAGVAIGFGAQSLIKDALNGLFIVLEDQFNNGDIVKMAGISGLVEDFNLRRTVLRDLDGIVHIVPNGQILTVSNYTREWARVNLNVPVAYSTDLDKAIAVINRVGLELSKANEFCPMIISAPQVLRVDKFADSGIEIKILGDVKPMKQWQVTGELRRRLKYAFDAEGIEIPFPHTKLFFDNAQMEKYAALARLADIAAVAKEQDAAPGPAPKHPAEDEKLPPQG